MSHPFFMQIYIASFCLVALFVKSLKICIFLTPKFTEIQVATQALLKKNTRFCIFLGARLFRGAQTGGSMKFDIGFRTGFSSKSLKPRLVVKSCRPEPDLHFFAKGTKLNLPTKICKNLSCVSKKPTFARFFQFKLPLVTRFSRI